MHQPPPLAHIPDESLSRVTGFETGGIHPLSWVSCREIELYHFLTLRLLRAFRLRRPCWAGGFPPTVLSVQKEGCYTLSPTTKIQLPSPCCYLLQIAERHLRPVLGGQRRRRFGDLMSINCLIGRVSIAGKIHRGNNRRLPDPSTRGGSCSASWGLSLWLTCKSLLKWGATATQSLHCRSVVGPP